jgi:hypothetical protein
MCPEVSEGTGAHRRAQRAFALLKIAHQSRRQWLRLTEGKQMTARKLLGLHAEALLRYPTLELIGEEPVITTREDEDWDVWPSGQRKACLE